MEALVIIYTIGVVVNIAISILVLLSVDECDEEELFRRVDARLMAIMLVFIAFSFVSWMMVIISNFKKSINKYDRESKNQETDR